MTTTADAIQADQKHTPGPWEATDQGDVVMGDDRATIIAWCGDAEDNPEMGEATMLANARLIAAAPDMLRALKDLTRFCDAVRVQVGMGKTQLARLEQARAAIAKAEGRS
jgi:hypothetical protein